MASLTWFITWRLAVLAYLILCLASNAEEKYTSTAVCYIWHCFLFLAIGFFFFFFEIDILIDRNYMEHSQKKKKNYFKYSERNFWWIMRLTYASIFYFDRTAQENIENVKNSSTYILYMCMCRYIHFT